MAPPQNLWVNKKNKLTKNVIPQGQAARFPHSFSGVVAHGCAVNEAKDANPAI
jgi:hypothetical protein